MSRVSLLATWIAQHWQGDTERWFQSLVEADLPGFDWPAPFGANWNRQDQYTFVAQLAEQQCPLMPESLSVIAPLLLQFGSDLQKQKYLVSIRTSPLMWTFEGQGPNRCWLDDDNDTNATLMIAMEGAEPEILGQSGAAMTQLAQAVSPALLLQEYLLGLNYLMGVDNEQSAVVSELRLQADVLMAHFLRNNPVTDAQLSLLVTRSRLALFSELFNALGYYALIDAPVLPGDNEPVPFAKQRQHLQQLRTLVSRNEMVQQDQIYEQQL